VRRTGRTTQGVLVQRLREDDRVAAVALVRSSDDPDAEGGAGEADLELPADLVDEALEATPGEVVELDAVEDIEEVDVEAEAFDDDVDPDELVDDEGEVVDELDEAIEDGDAG
jgi:hypothetical protein